jgi:5S rRNA maturation endonuclease (ribonuclease M5)
MTAESLAQALNARRVGSGWMARCPSHDDHKPSLSIHEIDGTVLVKCHAACSQSDVIAALRARGLWEPSFKRTTKDRRIVEIYDYTDEYGGLLYQVVRYDPKDFHQRRPDGCGGWRWRKGERQVLYRLREVLVAPIVFVVEGERDVETLRSHGFVATTNAGGANAPWLTEYSETLRGRECIIIPDADTPGRQRALRIARSLIGRAANIIILELDRAKDVTDWFQHGHSELELIALVESVEVGR